MESLINNNLCLETYLISPLTMLLLGHPNLIHSIKINIIL
jgi:hypothetical protein